jgi:hypothetical protein
MSAGPAEPSARESKIRSILDDLMHQRRAIEARGADEGLRQANRLGIVYWQQELRRAAAHDGRVGCSPVEPEPNRPNLSRS